MLSLVVAGEITIDKIDKKFSKEHKKILDDNLISTIYVSKVTCNNEYCWFKMNIGEEEKGAITPVGKTDSELEEWRTQETEVLINNYLESKKANINKVVSDKLNDKEIAVK